MAIIQTLYDKDGNPVYLTTKVEAIADNDSTSLQQLLYEKVDKVTGKDLSENNFSDANVQTLASAEQTANKVTTFTNASDTTYPTTKLVDTRFAAYENISVIIDIVESYAALIAYDLQLKANSVIKVLVDETKDNKSTYYRWTKISGNIFNWVYVGDDPKTMINDNTISTTDVWSSSKTNEEINKLLPKDVAEPILYEDLFALWEAGDLSTGMQYLITDYQTTYLMPHTEEVVICDVEPILVTATSNTTISPIAYSPRYPNDIIYYDIDSERIYGVGGGGLATSSSGSGSGSGSGVLSELMQPGASKGYIFRRVDTLNKIDAGFDWRTVKFRRWGIDYEQIPIYNDTTTYQKGDLVRSYDGLNIYVTIKTGVYGNNGIVSNNFARLCGSNDIILYKPNDVKLTPFQTNTLNANIANYRDYSFIPKSTDDGSLSDAIKNIYFGTNTSDIIYRSNTVIIKGSYNIKIGSDCYHNTIGGGDNESYDFELADNCVGNTVGSGFVDNNIGKDFKNNLFGTNCSSNTFGNDCQSNLFGNNCKTNTFGNNCQSNTFGNSCHTNTFGNDCQSNRFGNNCYFNSFDSNCSYSNFGNNCKNNMFGDSCQSNTFGNDCQNNMFDDSFNYNTLGEGCQNNTFDYNCFGNTFGNSCNSNTFGDYCAYNTFGNYCHNNTYGNNCQSNTFYSYCSSNTFSVFCQYNTFGNGFSFNTFGNGCNNNTFGEGCESNTFGNSCGNNTFGNSCNTNTLGNNCQSNTFGNTCRYNTFGNDCNNNTFGNWCDFNKFSNGCGSNTFGDSCGSNTFNSSNYNTFGYGCGSNTFGYGGYSNTLGNNCQFNTFGNNCGNNNFYAGTSGTTKKNYIKYLVLEDGCRYNNFYSELTTSSSSRLQRIRIKGLENSSATSTQITLSDLNTKYEWLICYTSTGVLKQYCPEYSLINNYTYKIEDTTVSTWAASTAYAGYGYQAQINITDLNEADSVNVVFGVNEAISGNYAPAIEIYSGYILVFSKVDTTIIIPTIEITKIEL